MSTAYTVTITETGSAFRPYDDDSPSDADYSALREVARILRGLADRLDVDDVPDVLLDRNGNRCGEFLITAKER